jgi:alpha-1,2-mannosyltransferase
LYPVYPLIAYLASTAVSKHIPTVYSRTLGDRNPFSRKVLILMIVVVSGILAVSRVFSNYNNYLGVIRSWTALYEKHRTLDRTGSVRKICVGNEWYVFPSHFFLDDDVQLAFVQEEFRGVLPQYFNSFTWATPKHPFNDKNLEEKSRYVEISQCDFFVLTVEKGKSSLSQISQDLRLKIVQTMPYQAVSNPVIQPSSSPALTRAFFVPYISTMKNVYAQYTVFSNN